MTIIQLLEKLAGGSTGLLSLLSQVGQRAPDLAPLAQEWITKLGQAVSASNIAELAGALPSELADVLKGNIDPRDNPSNDI